MALQLVVGLKILWNFDVVSCNVISNNTVKSMVKSTIKSVVKSTVHRFCRKYCNVLVHCQYLVEGMYGQENSQEYFQENCP